MPGTRTVCALLGVLLASVPVTGEFANRGTSADLILDGVDPFCRTVSGG